MQPVCPLGARGSLTGWLNLWQCWGVGGKRSQPPLAPRSCHSLIFLRIPSPICSSVQSVLSGTAGGVGIRRVRLGHHPSSGLPSAGQAPNTGDFARLGKIGDYGDASGCHPWGSATGIHIQRVVSRDVANHPTMHRTALSQKRIFQSERPTVGKKNPAITSSRDNFTKLRNQGCQRVRVQELRLREVK